MILLHQIVQKTRDMARGLAQASCRCATRGAGRTTRAPSVVARSAGRQTRFPNCVLLLLFLAATSTQAGEKADRFDWAKERQFWSFQPPRAYARPAVRNQRWPAQPLDYFVLAKLEAERLQPSPEADRRTLIRRVTLDLTGLPPTPEEVERFVTDRSGDAYPRLVERLLASPRFGERLASLWLPLARYAEDQAHQVGSDTKFFYPNAHLYRQWVIDAFNEDLRYDQFLKYQLAADKFEGATNHLAALGFIGLGPKYYNRGRLEVQADEWEDRVDTVSRGMLGLTVACARCHDHKFEPVTMTDYYALAGVFASTKMVNKTPDGKTVQNDVSADKMGGSTLHMIEEGNATNLNVFLRGNVQRKGPVAERRFLQVLSGDDPVVFQDGSGRKDLAGAIASTANPLTARVMINRLWGAFFGRPLVPTPSNFGHSGQPPTHPELLDDLAVRFMRGGWSVKSLVREMVFSAAYRQTADATKRHQALDAENQWLGHASRRRLSIEQWRDSVLAVTGQLILQGGKSLELDDPANRRRTVFARVSRLKLNDVLMQFDYPDANVHAEKRSTTSTPLQKLFLLNNEFILEQSRALVARPRGHADRERIQNTYQLLFARAPQERELEFGQKFLRSGGADARADRWQQYAQALLISNEMWYVD